MKFVNRFEQVDVMGSMVEHFLRLRGELVRRGVTSRQCRHGPFV